MWDCGAASDPRSGRGAACFGAALVARALLAACVLQAAPLAAQEAPGRVVSINLCTDQLAMLLAAPGQLVAISHVARDPHVSSMAVEAAGYPAIRGGAEEVFRLAPDLVLAGRYTTRATVAMLRRLGVPVVEVDPVSDLAGVAAQLRAVGTALGRAAEAEALLAEMEAGLAALSMAEGEGPRVALFSANGWSSGGATLAGAILARAGLRNVADEIGLAGGGVLGLERLAMAAPDVVVTATPYAGASRAEAVMAHPAVAGAAPRQAARADADWICGTPHILRAVAAMAALREAAP